MSHTKRPRPFRQGGGDGGEGGDDAPQEEVEMVVSYELPTDATASGGGGSAAAEAAALSARNDDPLTYLLRQAAVRCLERFKLGHALRPFDTLFAVFDLYYELPTAPAARLLLNSHLRLPFRSPVDIVQALDERSLADVISEVNDVKDAALAAGATALAAVEATEVGLVFWCRLFDYTEALYAARQEESHVVQSRQRPPISSRAGARLEEMLRRCSAQLPTVIDELAALARCPMPGIDREFYAAAVVVARLVHAENRLSEVDELHCHLDEPPPPPEALMKAQDPRHVMSEGDYFEIMRLQGEDLKPDEELLTAEVNIDAATGQLVSLQPAAGAGDPSIPIAPTATVSVPSVSSPAPTVMPPPPRVQPQFQVNPNSVYASLTASILSKGAPSNLQPPGHAFHHHHLAAARAGSGTPMLPPQAGRKPERFAKVITGYAWHKYNRTHYAFGSGSGPPPKTVMAYEFTLLYPDLPAGLLPRFRVEPGEKGWEDEFCYIIFTAPWMPSMNFYYVDVAYRIQNKQWDKRRGGMRSTFDITGKFVLYFRFVNASYRR